MLQRLSYTIIICCLLSVHIAVGQDSFSYTDNNSGTKNISADEIGPLKTKARKTIQDYYNVVSDLSGFGQDNFKQLFSTILRPVIWPDLALYPTEMVTPEDYIQLKNHFEQSEYQLTIFQAELIQVEKTADEYVMTLVVHKQSSHLLDKESRVVPNEHLRIEKLEMVLVTCCLENIYAAKIRHIKTIAPPPIRPADNFTYIIPNITYNHFTSVSPDANAYWSMENIEIPMDATNGLSAGATLMTNRLFGKGRENRNWYMSFGIEFKQAILTSRVTNWVSDYEQTRYTNSDSENFYYDRKIMLHEPKYYIEEELELKQIAIPIGLSYLLSESPTGRSKIFLNTGIIPGFAIGGQISMTGLAYYEGSLGEDQQGNPISLTNMSINVGGDHSAFIDTSHLTLAEHSISAEEDYAASFDLALKLGLSWHLKIGRNTTPFYLILGADYIHNVNPGLQAGDSDEIAFLFPDEPRSGFLKGYHTDIPLHHLSFRLGFGLLIKE